MKVTNWRHKIRVSLVAAGMLAPSAAFAVNIPIGDPSFEAFVVPAGSVAGYAYSDQYRPTSAWIDDQDMGSFQDDGDSNWLYNSAYGEVPAGTPPGRRAFPRTGDQAMHGRGGYNTQQVANVFEAGKTYTFSIYAQGDENSAIIGNNTDGPGWDSRVWLYMFDGNVPFSEDASLTFARYSPAGDRFNQNDFINRPVGSTSAQSQALWQKISISHTTYSDSPEVGHPIGVGFFQGFDASVDDASLSVDTNILTLEVNTTNGAMRIVNETGKPVSLDYYDVSSAASALNKAGWVSLQDQNQPGFPAGNGSGNGWEEAGGATNAAIGESYLTGRSQIAAATNLSLGNAFTVGGAHDLYFQYNQATVSGTTADFNADSRVDGNDFLRWQRGAGSFGPTVTTASGNANTDSTVNAADLAQWRAQFGNNASAHGPGELTRGNVRYVTSFSAAAVPEPASLVIAGLGVMTVLCVGRSSRTE
jgi:hypothetical protein